MRLSNLDALRPIAWITTKSSHFIRHHMPDAILVLTVISTLLTLIGSYRFVSYVFRNDPLFAGAIATAVTVIYLAVFEIVVVFMGVLALVGPIGLIAKRREVREFLEEMWSGSGGASGPNSTTGTICYCPACGKTRKPNSQFCQSCGERFDSGTSVYKKGNN